MILVYSIKLKSLQFHWNTTLVPSLRVDESKAGFSLGRLHMVGGQAQGDKALMGGLMRGT